MRNIKIFMALALLTFLFSGCGGSAGTDSTSTLHETVTEFLTGTWNIDTSSSNYSGTGVIASSTAVTLTPTSALKLSFSGIEFAGDSNESAGNVEVFYSYVAAVSDYNGNSQGNLSVKSYTSSSATTKTQSMVMRRIADDEWTFTSTASSTVISVKFLSQEAGTMEVTITGSGTLSNSSSVCNYTVKYSMIRISSTAITDEATDDTTLHAKLIEFLEGSWAYTSGSGYVGTATNTTNGTTTAITLSNLKILRMVFSDISFASDDDDSAGNANVYYSHSASAYDSDWNSLGILSIRSYASGATTKTQEAIITHVTDNEWILQTSSVTITLNIPSFDTGKINVTITGSGYISSLGSSCEYTVSCPLVKTGTSTEIDDEDDTEDTTTDNSSVIETLEGTWKLITEDEASATSTALGTERVLTLQLATDVYMTVSNINLEPDANTTSLTGTANVTYAHKWTAFDDSDIMQGNEGDFSFSKDESMKFVKVSDGVWRIEDTENSNENIVITITSESEISTVWTGTATTLDGMNYRYNITASFRKQ